MASKYYLGVADYVIIVLTLLISAAIGFKFRLSGGMQRTTRQYLMAGKNMSKLPVILSISVTMVSAVSMLGTPAEIYRYGIQNILKPLSMPIGMALAAYIFIPVYFQCGVSTVYEFLEMRYGKTTRYIVSFMFIVQMVLYMASVLYAPVLAMSAVTDLSIELSIVVFGAICTLYCAVGGLKGVLWTDVFQSILMTLTLITIYAFGIYDAGGIVNIYNTANMGKRLNICNFKLDFVTRYTVWNSIFQGMVSGFGCYGTNQIEVQRMLSLSNAKRAKSTLLISIAPVVSLYALCYLSGLLYYAIFYLCDPILNGEETGLTKYDQIVPFYIVTRFNSIPGLTGLCIAGIFSGSLSTISSALNSLATVTVVDFIQPLVSSTRLSETKSVILAKALSLLYGLICICLAFTYKNVGSVKQLATLLLSVVEGPVAAVFTVGVLTQKATSKCVLFGLLVGFSLSSWISYGTLISRYIEPPLPLTTSMCASTLNSSVALPNTFSTCFDSVNCSSTMNPQTVRFSETFILYKVSFQWIRPIGFLTTLLSTLVAVLATGWNDNGIPLDSKCLSPVTRLWKRQAPVHAKKPRAEDFPLETRSSYDGDIESHIGSKNIVKSHEEGINHTHCDMGIFHISYCG